MSAAKPVSTKTKNDLRVLIVEDSEDDCLLLVHELRRGGYNPIFTRVENRSELQEALINKSWDIVITDHRLPQFNSEAALDTVQQHDSDIPVIIVSGSIGEDFAVRVMRSGAHDYIMKGNLTRLVPVIEREIREAKFRKKARYHEKHDALTGLRNRTEFEQEVKHIVENFTDNGFKHAFLYLDLDQFKIINDTCGHKAGDELLSQVTGVIKMPIRESDTLARLGGDEFGILLQNCPLAKAKKIAERILSMIAQFKFEWKGRIYNISASIGLVMITDSKQNYHDIMSAADIACYAAKDSGRNRLHIYRKDDISLMKKHGEMRWVMRIRDALEANDFVLYKQKIETLNDAENKRKYFEFLVRMRNADDTLILPGAFIAAAERYNIMTAVDKKVIELAFQYVAEQPNKNDDSKYFINLSGNSLDDESLFPYIQMKLKSYKLNAEQFCFEITETATVQNIDKALEFITEIRKQGFSFALDDFGAGISSYYYLKKLPVDYIKIDGSFVVDILDDPINSLIVESVAKIGDAAGLQVIAEYVENKDIKSKLIDMGITMGQGYSLHRPEPL